jgi:hypothetical protein
MLVIETSGMERPVRIAWFRPDEAGPGREDHLDDIIIALGALDRVSYITEAHAHDFVWRHARGHFDLCVYELDNTARHQFMWPYLLHYPGLLVLRSATLHDARRARLVHEGRRADYAAEIAFAGGPKHVLPPWHLARGQWPMLRIPVTAARLTVVEDSQIQRYLQTAVPEAAVRLVDAGVAPPLIPAPRPDPAGEPRVAILEESREAVVRRAIARAATDMGLVHVQHALVDEGRVADVAVALRWPLHGRPLVSAVQAMSVGAAVVVPELYGTAHWPALDPQTWQQRDVEAAADGAAVAVSIDPRDEEHSLVLALRRLLMDAPLRRALGEAGRTWWAAHATIDRATRTWRAVLHEAMALRAPARPPAWPAHLDADGTALARRLLLDTGTDPLAAGLDY